MVAPFPATARGPKNTGAIAPGTGSKASSARVKGHINRNGVYVQPHVRSTPDAKFQNNWHTKGNTNFYTGEPGTRVTKTDAK